MQDLTPERGGMDAAGVLIEAGRLAEAGEAFALCTVVDIVRPASTRRGDRALVSSDGRLVGWVGGACSEPIVVREALRALEAGEPRLVRICPPDRLDEAPDGIVVAASMCASEGVVDVLVEPQLPRPLLAVVGGGPAADTLRRLATEVGWRVAAQAEHDADAVVVATMGHGDEDVLEAALAAGAPYVGLVASARRAAAVLDALRRRGIDDDAIARVRSPAGLDLGPCTQPEIAVAVLAELVAWRHDRPPVPATPVIAVDPVCGMDVAVVPTAETAVHDGRTYLFCSAGCRSRFAAEPSRYTEVPA
jgi:xanthine dehydrogenase accessory factor